MLSALLLPEVIYKSGNLVWNVAAFVLPAIFCISWTACFLS